MTKIEELENVLLNQIEMLNDDSLLEDKDKAELAIKKSKSISDLADSFIGLRNSVLEENRVKIDMVKIAMSAEGYAYSKYLGIEEIKAK
jgi:hypothetical protein